MLLTVPAAADDVDGVAVTKKLWEATVTVRVSVVKTDANAAAVTAFSGVVLGSTEGESGGLIVTFSNAPSTARFRVTLPDGEQADAKLSVLDRYSGLSLLELEKQKLKGLQFATEHPPVGSTIFTAAAAGIEKPVISKGILGGIDRKLPGSSLPPLLQCDLRTTGTSRGAAVVDGQGQMIGVVAATAIPGEGDGWTYAVPVRHVQRLVRSRAEGKVIELRRRRPSLGLSMIQGQQKDQVQVERVIAGGPADKSGIQQGDQIIEVDGLKVRNVYQVVSLVLKRQPGDQLVFSVRNKEQVKKLRVTLGGGAIVPPGGQVGLTKNGGQWRRIPADPRAAEAPRIPRDQVSLLQEQVKRFGAYIQILRKQVQLLEEENSSLRKRLESK